MQTKTKITKKPMTNKTIKEQMSDIVEAAKKLQQLMDEPIAVSNKIWVPKVGVVDLWEVTNQHGS